MATTFRPGDAFGVVDGIAVPASIVGSQPVWSDDSDSTYVRFQQDTAGTPQERAHFAPGEFAAVATTAVGIKIRAKVATINPGAAAQFALLDDPVTTGVFASVGLVDGWNETPTLTEADLGGPMADFLNSSQLMVLFNSITPPGGSDPYDFRILEVEVVIFPADAAPYVAPAYVRPSLRMTQRGGEGGMYGVPRMVGNPVHGLRQGPGAVY